MSLSPVFCGRDCGGDACPLLAEVEGGRVVRIRRNPAAGPYIRGCPKGFALPHFHYSPERLKTPLLRDGPRGSGRFKPIGWDEALRRVAQGLSDCRERYGAASVLCLSGAGCTGALHNTEALSRRFLNATGGCSVLEGNYSSAAAGFALRKAFGGDFGRSGFDAATLEKSNFIVLWGANVLEARLGAEIETRLLAASRRGVPIVSIDPRRTKTAERLGAEWLPVKPGSDAALMYALLFALDQEGRIDFDFAEARAIGFRDLIDYAAGRRGAQPKTPEWAAALCGLEADKIRGLARRWARTKPLALIPGYSIQRTEWGEETARLCVALQLATGNFGLLGASTGSLNNRLPKPRVGRISEGAAPRNRRVPIVRWADYILAGQGGAFGASAEGPAGEGAGGVSADSGSAPAAAAGSNGAGFFEPDPSLCPARIKAVYSAGGNFLNQGADIEKNLRAFAGLDFAVCHELFMTPTAKYCDIVLPAASPLQKEDIGIPWAGNFLLYKPRILPYEGLERSDYEIFRDLADRLGAEKLFSEGRDESGWIDCFLECSEVVDVGRFKESGIYFGAENKRPGLEDFARDPKAFPLLTPSGKIELGGGFRWAGWIPPPGYAAFPAPLAPASASPGQPAASAALFEQREWLLVTPKRAERVHSQGGDHPGLVVRNRLSINKADAESLGLAEGDIVEILSETGTTRTEIEPTDAIMSGVLSLFEGSWCAHASFDGLLPGSANYLISSRGSVESLSCVMHGIKVRLRKT